MNLSTRSLLVPGTALATAGVLALAPSVVAPAPTSLAAPLADVPMVQISDIQLAGIGRDIYNEITTFVQYTVTSAQYWIALVPVIGPPIADQVGINYFGLIQPVIANTVYVISDIIANPVNLIAYGATYFSQLGYIGYNWASDQAQFFGLPPFPPIPAPPPLASVKAPTRGGATAPSPAAAVEAPEAVAVEAPRATSRASAVRADRPAAGVAAPAAAAESEAADVVDAAPSAGESRGSDKAAAGQAGKAAAKSRGGAAG
ncbi:MAG: hypothetical protein K8R24_01905 [Mycobacterium sp.]|nr:hypothetical protein [Mycobacterium sp.]